MICHFFARTRIVTSILFSLFIGTLSAEDSTEYKLNGYGHWQVGQVIKGRAARTMDHQWMTNALLGLKIEAQPSERLMVLFSPEFKLYFPYPELNGIGTRRSQSVSYINEVNGNFAFGDIESPIAELKLGLFNYKYNPDSKDLGEYLFRTGTYPPFMINNFDYAKARLCGGVLSVNPISDLRIDAILTSELQYYPLYDFSLAFLADYKISNALSFGAGIDFARLIPIKPSVTSPKHPNEKVTGQDPEAIRYNNKGVGDTSYSGYYSFKATKLMFRTTLDPKAFLPDLGFGKEDLKVYFETVLTGLPIKSFPDSAHPDLYGKISRLLPILVGVNIPAFNLLDVFSLEVEYFRSRMPNDYNAQATRSVPLPSVIKIQPPGPSNYNPEDYKERDISWAIYASKQVVKGFSLVGLIAYDHMRMPYTDGSESTDEAMTKNGDWAWQAKTKFEF
jgi:hypothetical protein